jgi:acyl homoserine lactone synthase
VRFTTGTPSVLPPALMADMARYRHKVFVGKLGWQLQCKDELEYDEFDRDDTVYVVAQDDNDDVVGTARLLPTMRPYLLAKVFPRLWGNGQLPSSPEIWELSRFAAIDFSSASSNSIRASSSRAADLMRIAASVAKSRGAKELISISPVAIERLLRTNGFTAHRAGTPQLVDGHPLVACLIGLY